MPAMPRVLRRRTRRPTRSARPVYKARPSRFPRKRFIKNRVENKYVDIAMYNDYVSTSAIVAIRPFALAQGSDFNARIGRQISPKAIQIKGFTTMDSTAVTTSIRLVMVQDKWNLGATPAWLDFMNTTSFNSLRLLDVNKFRRFKILLDKTFTLGINMRRTINFNVYKKLSGIIRFTGIAATDTGSNAIYVYAVSSEATYTPLLQVNTRCRFIDL